MYQRSFGTKLIRGLNPVVVTLFTILLLAIFLMPFLYMIFTSLKTPNQFAAIGAPIWPAAQPTLEYSGENTGTYTFQVTQGSRVNDVTIDMNTYAGKTLDIYTVPLPDGETKDLALVKGYPKESIFIDPDNPADAPIFWVGSYRSLDRPWKLAPTWENYVEVWNTINYPRLLGNTFFYALTTTIGVWVSCILVAYGFSRFSFPLRDFLFVVLLSTIFLPGAVTIIPTFTFFTKIGWVGTWLPLIVPAFFGNPYDIFLLRQYFMTLPRELDEAAMIDGAGPFKVLWSVIIPQSYPAILAVTIFHIVWAWNDYFGPLIYLGMEDQPISVALARFNGIYGRQPQLIQAGSLMTLIFPLILFLLAQRFFIQGIVITGVENNMKVTVIGGGSTYTPELVSGFLARLDKFPLTELWLMDIDPQRLEIVGGFAQRIVANHGAPFKVELSTNQRAAVSGASYVTTQLRVGQMEARRRDEYLGLRHGLIGQETTGVGGMAKAMRTIPVVLKIAADMREMAPGAMLVNFTNPAGLVTQALSQYAADVPSVGVCNVPITTKMSMLSRLEKGLGQQIDPERAELKTLGLNHLSWHRGFTVDGEDVWPQIMASYLAELRTEEHPEWDVRTVEVLGMIPNYYLQYFYHTDKKLAAQAKWPPSRADEVIVVEEALLRQYADPDLKEPPADLMKRGGAYYSTVATQLLTAHYNNLGETHVVNIPNQGAVPEWPANWVLEMPATVRRGGIQPIPTQPLPPACFGLIAQVKSFELLTVEAAVYGDRDAAYQALLAHPLGPTADKIQAVLDDMLETHRDYLPQFWK